MKGKSASPTPTEQYLSFSLNPSLQALLSAHQLAEIIRLDPSQILPISEMPLAVIGVCPWQGEVLWLIDLAYLFGFDPLMKASNSQSNCSIIKAKSHRGNLGLWVAQVGELISCEPASIQPAELSFRQLQTRGNSPTVKASISPIQPDWILASWAHPDGILPIIDLEAILSSLLPE
ncbi:chemotaxis protein CheW [Capilliphycus salinus ALCB114379]|uniref:chemotaxis protein CheW n=1 Tax=Capilliphycus salinus TaxID=2768948 RepID=UPI0039A54E79